MKFLSLGLMAVLMSPSSAFAEDMPKELFVQSRYAEIKAAPTMDSATLGLSAIGEKLVEVERDSSGMWIKVRNARGEGWVSRFLVTSTSLESMYQAQRDREAREKIAMREDAGTRGPASVGSRKKRGKEAPYSPAMKNGSLLKLDLSSVEKLDKFKVSESELRQFQKRAKLSTN